MVNFIANAFLTIVQFVLRVVKKALCCFRRRRRFSCEPMPLTNIGIVPNSDKDGDMQTWGSWDDSADKVPTMITTSKPVDPVQQQIEMYRQQRIALSQNESKEEPKVDYFQDMVPKIVKPKKMLLQSRENEECFSTNNFSLAPDPVFGSSELGVWEDTQSWEDQTEQAWDANDMLREKKKVDREERLAMQQRKKLERKSKIQGTNSTGWGQAQIKNNFCSFPEGRVEIDPH